MYNKSWVDLFILFQHDLVKGGHLLVKARALVIDFIRLIRGGLDRLDKVLHLRLMAVPKKEIIHKNGLTRAAWESCHQRWTAVLGSCRAHTSSPRRPWDEWSL
jgi:hypothetical protein